MQDIETMPNEKDIDFIRVWCVPLQAAIKSEASTWVYSIGKLLHDSVKASLSALTEQLDKVQLFGEIGSFLSLIFATDSSKFVPPT